MDHSNRLTPIHRWCALGNSGPNFKQTIVNRRRVVVIGKGQPFDLDRRGNCDVKTIKKHKTDMVKGIYKLKNILHLLAATWDGKTLFPVPRMKDEKKAPGKGHRGKTRRERADLEKSHYAPL